GFGFQPDIVEASLVPQDHEIAAQRLFVVDVALLGNDQRLQGVLRHPLGAAEFKAFNHLAGRVRGGRGRFLGRFQLRALAWLGGGRRRRSGRRSRGRRGLRRGGNGLEGTGLRRGRGGRRLWLRLRLRRRPRLRGRLLGGRLGEQRRADGDYAETGRDHDQAETPEKLHASIPFHSAQLR